MAKCHTLMCINPKPSVTLWCGFPLYYRSQNFFETASVQVSYTVYEWVAIMEKNDCDKKLIIEIFLIDTLALYSKIKTLDILVVRSLILAPTSILTSNDVSGLMANIWKIPILLKSGRTSLAAYGIIKKTHFHPNHTNQNTYLYERILNIENQSNLTGFVRHAQNYFNKKWNLNQISPQMMIWVFTWNHGQSVLIEFHIHHFINVKIFQVDITVYRFPLTWTATEAELQKAV